MAIKYRTEPVHRTMFIHEQERDNDTPRRHLPPHAYEPPGQPKPHPEVADMASVLGLPADAVTPHLLSAVTPLLAEMDRLRWQAAQAERLLATHERQADRHSVVPCLDRRAFVRELDSFLSGGESLGALVLIQVAGVEALRQIYGLAAGEGALRHIAAHILGAVRSTDLVGCLGGSDFALLLPGSPADQARAKADEILARLTEQPFTWLGQRIPLQPAIGLTALSRGLSAEQAIATADRNRRGME